MFRTSKPGYGRALTRLTGNLTGATSINGDKLMAWYVERPVQWSYLSTDQLEATLDGLTRAHAALAGRNIHRRVSTAEYPVEAWARDLDADTPDPVNWDAWREYLAATQRVMFNQPMAAPVVFLGVEVGKTSLTDRVRAFRKDKQAVAAQAASKFAEELATVETAMAGIAAPATQLELEWLTHRSIGLGLPAPTITPGAGVEPLTESTLTGLFDTVNVDPGPPLSRTLHVVGAPGRNSADPVERHVVVMSVGRMEEQRIPENHGPWLARMLQFAGVEVSMRGRMQTGTEAATEVGRKIDRLLDQNQQYQARGIHAPLNSRRVLDHAVTVQDVMQEAWHEDAVTWKGQVRVTVDGATAKEALARAEQLKLHMQQQRIAVHIMGAGREAVAAEFIPGEPTATTEYTRRMPARLFSASVPQASSTIGDGQGLRLGYMSGATRSPFTWGLHHAMENDRSGVTPIVADQGAGKSYVLGALCGLSALQGVYTTYVSPPAAGAAITQWAPIKAHSAVMDVMSSAFSPYAVFPEPRTRDFYDHPDNANLEGPALERAAWEMARDAEKVARFERYQLVLDCLRGVLNHDMAVEADTEIILSDAIHTHNDCKASSSVKGVLRELRVKANKTGDPKTVRLADALERIADLPRARNWMLADPQDARMTDARLLVMTMEGLQLPQHADPSMWSASERLSVPLLSLAMHYAYSRVYRRPRHERKLVAFDEAHYLKDWPSGRALLSKMERESRKWNIRALIASQDAATTLQAQDASRALINDVIVGHCSSPDEQRKCAELLHLDSSFAPEIGRLRPANEKRRDFLMRIDGQVGRVQFTLDEVPELAALLSTTPKQNTARDLMLDGQEGWFVR